MLSLTLVSLCLNSEVAVDQHEAAKVAAVCHCHVQHLCQICWHFGQEVGNLVGACNGDVRNGLLQFSTG